MNDDIATAADRAEHAASTLRRLANSLENGPAGDAEEDARDAVTALLRLSSAAFVTDDGSRVGAAVQADTIRDIALSDLSEILLREWAAEWEKWALAMDPIAGVFA